MTIITSLLTGVEYDTDIQRVSENQIVIFFGYAMRQSRYVVCRVEYTPIGYTYTMLDPDTYEYHTTETIMPLSQKHGIGYYYDGTAPEFMDSTQVALIKEEAERKHKEQEENRQAERERMEQLKAVGRKRMEQILPHGAKAIIVARLKQDDSDPMTDLNAAIRQCRICRTSPVKMQNGITIGMYHEHLLRQLLAIKRDMHRGR